MKSSETRYSANQAVTGIFQNALYLWETYLSSPSDHHHVGLKKNYNIPNGCIKVGDQVKEDEKLLIPYLNASTKFIIYVLFAPLS